MFYHLDNANWYHFPPCFTFHDKGDDMHPEHTLTLSAPEAQEQEIVALVATGTGRWQKLVRSIQSMKLVPLRKSRSVSQM